MTMTIEILPVRTSETIARTAALARTVWREHYTPIIGSEQVAYMLEHFQSEPAIAEQVGKGLDYFLVLSDGRDAGYFALVPETGSVMLSKLYVESAFRGKGTAAEALRFIGHYCREHGTPLLWLTVNKNNAAAIAWYLRQGFVNAGPVTADIGNGFVMDDYRMEKRIVLSEAWHATLKPA